MVFVCLLLFCLCFVFSYCLVLAPRVEFRVFGGCCSLLVNRCSLFVVRCSLLFVYGSLFVSLCLVVVSRWSLIVNQ